YWIILTSGPAHAACYDETPFETLHVGSTNIPPGRVGGGDCRRPNHRCRRVCAGGRLRRLSSKHLGNLPADGHGAIFLSPFAGKHCRQRESHLLPPAVGQLLHHAPARWQILSAAAPD